MTQANDWLEAMRRKAEYTSLPSNRRGQGRLHEEDNLQIACRTWFDLQYPHLRLLLHHSPNEGLLVKRAADGAKRKAMGVRAGFPDFIFLLPTKASPYLCLELKTAKGRQSESQRQYQKLVEQHSGSYVVIRTLEEFINTIKSYVNGMDKNRPKDHGRT